MHTHLAQIAAFRSPLQDLKRRIRWPHRQRLRLWTKEKTREIARMLGGLHVTETTFKNAEELIDESVL